MDTAESIFERMSGLARAHGAINLGQGFPDHGWPEPLVARAAALLTERSNQYPPMRGLPELRAAVARHHGAHGLDVPAEGVVVTAGASEALAAAILALVRPGDVVAMFEPLYDLYLPMVARAGGVARVVRLVPPDWAITPAVVDEAFADPAPRLVILNNPHNPTATVWDRAALAPLAAACVAADALALADEVWEGVVFDGRAHTPLATLPGMAERTITVGSAGKMFALTGWKVGWAAAPPHLAERIAGIHQYLTFVVPPNLQAAVAWGLTTGGDWLAPMTAAFQAGRDTLAAALAHERFVTLPSAGTYFLNVDLAASGLPPDDLAFCLRAVAQAGVAAIPVSAFYHARPARGVVRLCFAKAEDTLVEGARRFSRAR